MKERKIGRLLMYVKIVEMFMRRGYVVEIKGRKKFFLMEKGIKVYYYFVSKYRDFVSEERMREFEEIMDCIEEGIEDYIKVFGEFYLEI